RLADLRAHLDFLEDADYLRFTESGFLHVETPSEGILYLRLVQVFEGTSERHRIAGARYNAVGRQLEQITMGSAATLADMTSIRERLDALSAEMPHIPKTVHKEIAIHEDLSRWDK
ncbi:MAG: hypothetical protein J0I38_20825, partial [Hydrogenophaga sp.]|nr:hypothetical protein [Hydrogenophaga sp.]